MEQTGTDGEILCAIDAHRSALQREVETRTRLAHLQAETEIANAQWREARTEAHRTSTALQEALWPFPPEFVECDECHAKPGSPVLCAECLERRAVWSTREADRKRGGIG